MALSLQSKGLIRVFSNTTVQKHQIFGTQLSLWWSICLQWGRSRFNPWVGKISWRRKWHPTPVFLLGKSHGWRSLVGYSPRGHKESDTIERLHFHFKNICISFITEDSDCSHEIKRCLLLERKAMTNLNSILQSRDITLLTKVHIVKAMVFQVVMYGCEGWTIKKAEHWRIDAFELRCWKRLLRVPWTARSNQSILKDINPEYSFQGWMLKLKLQYFSHLM